MEVAFAEIIANPQRKSGEEDFRRFPLVELDHGMRFRIDDRLRFAKYGQLCDQVARRIHRNGIAIEDKLIVTAHDVAVADWQSIRARQTSDHLVADRGLMQSKRRRTQIDDNL